LPFEKRESRLPMSYEHIAQDANVHAYAYSSVGNVNTKSDSFQQV